MGVFEHFAWMYFAHLAQLHLHYFTYTTLLTPLIFHSSSHTTHLTQLISHHSPHTTHLTQLHLHYFTYTTSLEQLISHNLPPTTHQTTSQVLGLLVRCLVIVVGHFKKQRQQRRAFVATVWHRWDDQHLDVSLETWNHLETTMRWIPIWLNSWLPWKVSSCETSWTVL